MHMNYNTDAPGAGGGGGGADPGAAGRMYSTSYCHAAGGMAAYGQLMRTVDNKGFLDVRMVTDDDEDDEEGAYAEEAWRTRYCVLKDGALSVYEVREMPGGMWSQVERSPSLFSSMRVDPRPTLFWQPVPTFSNIQQQ